MEKYKVTIEGTSPILFSNPIGMIPQHFGKKSVPTPEEEAATRCYWLDGPGSELCFPSDNLKIALIQASSAYRFGKQSLAPFVAGSILLQPALLGLGTNKYFIDTRRAVVQRQGVLRSRPRLNEWKLSFEIIQDDDFPEQASSQLPLIIAEAGRRIGIGDYRPQKKGWFGKFRLIEFDGRPYTSN